MAPPPFSAVSHKTFFVLLITLQRLDQKTFFWLHFVGNCFNPQMPPNISFLHFKFKNVVLVQPLFFLFCHYRIPRKILHKEP